MATPTDVLDAIVEALEQSPEFDGGSYRTHELDLSGADNRLEQPFVSLKIIGSPRVTDWDSDLVGYVTNAAGDRIGRIYEATWELAIEAHVVVAAGNDDFNVTDLGFGFQQALLRYDAKNGAQPLPSPDGGTVDDVDHFLVGEGDRDDDLAGPGLRRWRQELQATFSAETRRTEDPTVTDIETSDATTSHSSG